MKAFFIGLALALVSTHAFAANFARYVDCSGPTAKFDRTTGLPLPSASWMAKTCVDTRYGVTSVNFSSTLPNTLEMELINIGGTADADSNGGTEGKTVAPSIVTIQYSNLKTAQLVKAYFDLHKVVAFGLKPEADYFQNLDGTKSMSAVGENFVIRFTGPKL